MDRHCFYHAGCPDGFGAAYAVWSLWGEKGHYRPRGHDDQTLAAKDFGSSEVLFVDLTPSNLELRLLGPGAERLTVLDHHISSQKRVTEEEGLIDALQQRGHHILFDLNHSGAVLAWNHIHPNEPAPLLLQYVEDQDLWNWKLPHSREVNACIGSYPREFETWKALSKRPIEELAAEGDSIVRANDIDVQRLLSTSHRVRVGGQAVEAVNSAQNRANIGHELATRARFEEPWGCVYRIDGMRVHASLYSIGDFDVSTIAGDYGGGGHRNASGFSVSLDDWLENFL